MSNLIRSRIWKGKPGGSGGSGSGSGFNGQRNITRQTPGIVGYDPNTTTVVAFLENVFYPPVAPIAAISINNPIREIGAPNDFTLSWEVTEQSNAITGISVDGTPVSPTGGNQSGTMGGDLSDSIGVHTFDMSVTDGTLTGEASCTLQFLPGFYYGTTDKDGSGSAPILDSDILALTEELRNDYRKTFSTFGGGGKHLIFAFPSTFGTPRFTINGLVNTAFTLVRDTTDFSNYWEFTQPYDVWVSNEVYNSPLDSVILS